MQQSLRNVFDSIIKQLFLITALLFISSAIKAQQTINDSVNEQQLTKSIVGNGFTFSNAKLDCAPGAVATFIGTSDIGMERGILLTTGRASLANGPNNNVHASYNNGMSGDLQLDTLYGFTTYDGCSLEFDFVPSCDTLKINYVYGSEEYPSYINSNFADLFAIFISGPGIDKIKNLALNSKEGGKDYFIDNKNGTTIQYNGYTKPLTAIQALIPSNTYHLKIAIADVTDGSYDSGVFIEKGALQCNTLGVNSVVGNTGIQIYPNPANDVIYIHTPLFTNKNIAIRIYSIVGKVVYQESYLNNTQVHPINAGSIEANGVYFIQLQSGNEVITRKITINH